MSISPGAVDARSGIKGRRPRHVRMLVALAVIATATFAPNARAANTIWWPNFSANKISFTKLDGSGGGGDLASTTGATAPNQPDGVAFDTAAGRVYWSSANGQKISYANIDGTGGGGDLNTTGASVFAPRGLVVDHAAGRIYWAAAFGTSPGIYYANLDNSGGGQIATTGATVAKPSGVAIDKAAGRIYWANNDTSAGNKISYANLDGSGGGGDLDTTGATVAGPFAVAVHPAGGRIYWVNENLGSLSQEVAYASLSGGSGGGMSVTGACINCSPPTGIALDPAANRLYWSNAFTMAISFTNLDNSGSAGDLDDSGATVSNPDYPALLESPVAAGAPTVGGASTTGSTLSCSTGSWAPDLLGAALYRAPRTFTYQWSRDGTDIPGATSSTVSPGSPGSYSCKVTASNFAGSGGPQMSGALQVSTPPASPAPSPAAKKKKKCKKAKKGMAAAAKCKKKKK